MFGAYINYLISWSHSSENLVHYQLPIEAFSRVCLLGVKSIKDFSPLCGCLSEYNLMTLTYVKEVESLNLHLRLSECYLMMLTCVKEVKPRHHLRLQSKLFIALCLIFDEYDGRTSFVITIILIYLLRVAPKFLIRVERSELMFVYFLYVFFQSWIPSTGSMVLLLT